MRRGRGARRRDQETILVIGTPIERRAGCLRVARILACLTRDPARRRPIGVPLRMGRYYIARVAVDDEQAVAVGWAPVVRIAILSLFPLLGLL